MERLVKLLNKLYADSAKVLRVEESSPGGCSEISATSKKVSKDDSGEDRCFFSVDWRCGEMKLCGLRPPRQEPQEQ